MAVNAAGSPGRRVRNSGLSGVTAVVDMVALPGTEVIGIGGPLYGIRVVRLRLLAADWGGFADVSLGDAVALGGSGGRLP